MISNNIIEIKADNMIILPIFNPKLNSMLSNLNSHLIAIADYDNTMTKSFVNTQRSLSSSEVIDECSLVSPQLLVKTKVLNNEFHSYENDLSIDFNKEQELIIVLVSNRLSINGQ